MRGWIFLGDPSFPSLLVRSRASDISNNAGFTRRTSDPRNEPIRLNSWSTGRFVCRHTRPCHWPEESPDSRPELYENRFQRLLSSSPIVLVSAFSKKHPWRRIFERCSAISVSGWLNIRVYEYMILNFLRASSLWWIGFGKIFGKTLSWSIIPFLEWGEFWQIFFFFYYCVQFFV